MWGVGPPDSRRDDTETLRLSTDDCRRPKSRRSRLLHPRGTSVLTATALDPLRPHTRPQGPPEGPPHPEVSWKSTSETRGSRARPTWDRHLRSGVLVVRTGPRNVRSGEEQEMEGRVAGKVPPVVEGRGDPLTHTQPVEREERRGALPRAPRSRQNTWYTLVVSPVTDRVSSTSRV